MDLNPRNLTQTMLASKENWDCIANFIQDIMKKEAEERKRQSIHPI